MAREHGYPIDQRRHLANHQILALILELFKLKERCYDLLII